MSRKLLLILGVMVFAALACNAPAGDSSETQNAGNIATATAIQAMATTPPQTPTVGAVETQPTAVLPTAISSDPQFIGPIQFTDNADATIGGFAFAEGIKEVWALWQYANMREGLSIRRVWYLDGEVWIDRTVEWDFAKYGASGTIRDVSIFDRDDGLPAGRYQLELYIEGRLQDIAGNGEDARADFTIVDTDNAPHAYPSPSGGNIANVTGGKLELMCDGCTTRTLAEHAEIVDVDWFSDDEHLLYTVIDRSEQVHAPATMGLKWELWIVDVTDGAPYQISEGDERFHDAVISPNDTYIAVAAGTGFGDAGMMDLQLAFVELANFQRDSVRYAWEFGIIPDEMKHSVFPIASGSYPLPGQWSAATAFIAPMQYVGFEANGFEPGLYEFNLQNQTAQRVGDLPEP